MAAEEKSKPQSSPFADEFEGGHPFSQESWEDYGIAVPGDWEGKSGRVVETGLKGGGGDFVYFKHSKCNGIWRFAAGIVGPRAIRNLIKDHSELCGKDTNTPASSPSSQ